MSSFPTPILDDRSYAQLRDELIARIPVYAPEWTDHHPSDPGITLIELFAFLGENLLFRFNQIPDATKLAFLNLLHLPRRPAQPSTGMVRLDTKSNTGVVVNLSSRVLAGEVPFRTLDEVTSWPVEARPAIRALVVDELDADTQEYVNRAAASVNTTSDDAALYRTRFGAKDPMRPGGDVLDPVDAIDGALFVALTTEEPDLTAMAGGLLSIGVVPSRAVPTMADRDPCPGEGAEPIAPPMQWQICTTTPVADAEDPDSADPLWHDLDVVADTSAGLTAEGVIRLRLPSDLSDIGIYVPNDVDAIGAGDQPPLVEDPAINDGLFAWIRVFRPTSGTLPAIEWMGANAARVEQTTAAQAEFLGTGNGEPGQQRSLVNGNVVGEVELEVEEQGTRRWIPWAQVDDFAGSGVDDRHFVVDAQAGTITCGDGRRGRPWQLGERIRVRAYRHGGGAKGNVGPGAVSKTNAIDSSVAVSNPLPTRGGADAEPLTDAVARIPTEFARRDRAVTVSDFRQLAEATPGAGVARAETLRLFHPDSPTVDIPGAVSVVIWPAVDPVHPGAPRPDKPTLDAVCRHLDARRLVTTEVHVIPPTYRRIAVSVGISVKPGYGLESVRRWVELVLRQFLAPVPPYGPEGRGWPLGRPVFAPELEAAALQVEGVEFLVPGSVPGSPCLLGLRLATETEPGVWFEPQNRQVELESWEVPELAEITVIDGPALDPGRHVDPPVPSGRAVPVRSPVEVC